MTTTFLMQAIQKLQIRLHVHTGDYWWKALHKELLTRK